MKHLGTWGIRTERLQLRKFRPDDIFPMYCNWATDPEVTKFLSWSPHANIGVTHEIVSEWCAQYGRLDFYQWAIVLREINDPIGSISFHNVTDEGMAEMGCCIGRDWWRGGIATEATQAIMEFGFERLGLERIQAWHAEDNIGSRRTLEKVGLVPIAEAPQLMKGKLTPGTWLEITRERYAERYK